MSADELSELSLAKYGGNAGGSPGYPVPRGQCGAADEDFGPVCRETEGTLLFPCGFRCPVHRPGQPQ